MSKKSSYSFYSTFVYRAPSLPLDVLQSIPDTIEDIDSFILRYWEPGGLIHSSIRLASMELYRAITKSVAQNPPRFEQRTRLSFLHYFSRMATRATPFGILAGIGSGHIEAKEGTSIVLKPPDSDQLICRPDMGYLLHEMEKLAINPDFQPSLDFGVSDSVYCIGDQIRYIAATDSHKGKRSYQLESVESNEILQDLLSFAKSITSYDELVQHLIKRGYAQAESCNYLDQLIQAGILVHYPQPLLTRKMYKDQVIEIARKKGLNQHQHEFIRLIEFSQSICQLSDLQRIERPDRFQVDLLRNPELAKMSRSIAMQILKGIRLIRVLGDKKREDPLAAFKKSFSRRFGDRDVPLLLVFDPDYGIGLSGPAQQQQNDRSELLDDLMEYSRKGKHSGYGSHPKFHPEEKWTAGLPDYYELTEEDLRKVNIAAGEWPDQLFAMVSLAGQKEKPNIHFHMVSDGHPAGLLNRFGFLPDEDLQELLGQLLKDEARSDPDIVYAELVHLPEGRTGNILQRRIAHDYEIVLMAGSALPERKIIRPADILVRLEFEQVKLIHKETQKTILPILNNAHNFEAGQLPLYEFLVYVGKQHGGASYHLRNLLGGGHGKVPGIRADHLILRPTRWYLLNPFKKSSGHQKAHSRRDLEHWLNQIGLPQKVLLIHSDRNLYVDWHNQSLTEAFFEFVRTLEMLIFEPFVYQTGSPVIGPEGQYANELIVCFRKDQ